MRKHLTGVCTLLSLLLSAYAQAMPTDTLRLATGSETGNYFRVGRTISEIVQRHARDVHLEVINTLGSQDNLDMLARGEVDLAIVQNDMAYAAERGLDPFKQASISGLRGVMMLYTEPIFVVSSQPGERFFRSSGSRGLISVGKTNSGTRYNARTILMAARMWDDDLLVFEHIGDVREALLNGQIRYAFANSIPDRIGELVDADSLSILSLPAALIEGLTHTYSFLSRHTSSIVTDSIRTVAVRSMIVARQDLDARIAYRLTAALHEELPVLRAVFPQEQSYYAQRDVVHGMPLKRWHTGAYQYYQEEGIQLTQRYSNLWRYVLPVPPLLLALLGIFNVVVVGFGGRAQQYISTQSLFLTVLKNVTHAIVKVKYFVLFLAVGYLLLVCTFMIMQAEREWAIASNSISIFETRGFGDNLLWMFVFAFSGFEDGLFPTSPLGKFWATLFPLVSLLGFVTLVGMLTTDHIRHIMSARGKKQVSVKDHIILCGWNKTVPYLIQELVHDDIVTIRDIVVLANIDPAAFDAAINTILDLRQVKRSGKSIGFVQGCATKREDLKRANLADADIAVVIADGETEERDRDARNILKVLTIERYCQELESNDGIRPGRRLNRKNIYTIAEIENAENFETARDAMVDEIISYDHIRSKLFVQSILNPGVSAFFDEVLYYNEGNDFYSHEVESGSPLEGLSFDDLLQQLRKNKVLLLSIVTCDVRHEEQSYKSPHKLKHRVLTNPPSYVIRAGDRIIVLCLDEKTFRTALGEIEPPAMIQNVASDNQNKTIKNALNTVVSKILRYANIR